MKLCKDCKWFDASSVGPEYAHCRCPALARIMDDLVNGGTMQAITYCDTARNYGKCGVDGTHFEARPAELPGGGT